MKTTSHETTQPRPRDENVARYADMLAAMGTEARLRIMRLLLAAHPIGMVVGEIQRELGIPASTLSHHLDKLRREALVHVRREHQYLWYSANTEALTDLLGFLYAECCSRNAVLEPASVVEPACQPQRACRPTKEKRK